MKAVSDNWKSIKPLLVQMSPFWTSSNFLRNMLFHWSETKTIAESVNPWERLQSSCCSFHYSNEGIFFLTEIGHLTALSRINESISWKIDSWVVGYFRTNKRKKSNWEHCYGLFHFQQSVKRLRKAYRVVLREIRQRKL